MQKAVLTCPHCGRKIPVYEDEAGSTGTCPDCGRELKVPAELFSEQDEQADEWPADLPSGPQKDQPGPPPTPPLFEVPDELELETRDEPAPPAGRPAYEVPDELELDIEEPAAAPAPVPGAPVAPSQAPERQVRREAPREVRSRRGGRVARPLPSWAGTLVGSFLAAEAVVVLGDGWKAWLQYAAIGALLPIAVAYASIIPGFGWAAVGGLLVFVYIAVDIKFVPVMGLLFLPLAFLVSPALAVSAFVVIGAPAGAMYYYMVEAAAWGARPVQQARLSVVDDIFTPAILVTTASIVMALVPGAVAYALARYSGEARADELVTALLRGEELVPAVQQANLGWPALVILGALLFVFFFFPMVAMALGASEKVTKALNPFNAVMGVLQAPLEYALLWLFCLLHVAAVFVAAALLSVGLSAVLPPLLASHAASVGFMLLACYFASACGWRMGMFLHRHSQIAELVS
ncbi:MAG: hypothetical protein R6V05_06950 [Candidatus Brocadiia bacterium]